MLDMPPVEIVEMADEAILQKKKDTQTLLGRPFCPHPSTGTLESGTTKIYDGWITLYNKTDQDLQIQMRFILSKGYHLELSFQGEVLLSQHVKINKNYDIAESSEGISLISKD